jgi:hypothetical protein
MPEATASPRALTPRAREVLGVLADRGLLLKQDRRLPSVVGLITGESLRTSWWSHPKARLIFAVLAELDEHPDVLLAKLLHGKDTLVHRRLWPALAAVASTREPWQLRGLSGPARRLLARVERSGSARASGTSVAELTGRLLVLAEEVHTESGRHEMRLVPWAVWRRKARCGRLPSVRLARRTLEEAAEGIGAPLTALPWAASRDSAGR